MHLCLYNIVWPKKVSHYQIINKSYKPANEIGFFFDLSIGIKYSVRDLLLYVND